MFLCVEEIVGKVRCGMGKCGKIPHFLFRDMVKFQFVVESFSVDAQ